MPLRWSIISVIQVALLDVDMERCLVEDVHPLLCFLESDVAERHVALVDGKGVDVRKI